MNIYLDIDGVLLANEDNATNHVHEFLKLAHDRFPDSTYWLTTHCRGNAKMAVERLSLVLPPETIELLHAIKPTMWRVAKTEAIDLTQPCLMPHYQTLCKDLCTLCHARRAKLHRHQQQKRWLD